MKSHSDQTNIIKYFKFLNFWVNRQGFQDLVKEVWGKPIVGNPMWRLQQKLKKLGKSLSQWSRERVGDVHQHVEAQEAHVQTVEELELIDNSEQVRTDLNKAHAKYVRWLAQQESLLKQKSQIKWFEEGDCNSKYFHAMIRERRRKLKLHRIQNHRGR